MDNIWIWLIIVWFITIVFYAGIIFEKLTTVRTLEKEIRKLKGLIILITKDG